VTRLERVKLENIIAEHSKPLSWFCLKLCRDHHDAEDLFQDTWCKAVGKIHLYDETKPFGPWLFAICANEYKNAYSKAKRNPLAVYGEAAVDGDTAIDIADTTPVFDEEQDAARQAVDGLDEKHRLVVILHYFSDYSVEEVAYILGVPQGTVKSRLHKARETLKTQLA
jgi:RNA polymerase sigma-70 factor (ECF subfamily)